MSTGISTSGHTASGSEDASEAGAPLNLAGPAAGWSMSFSPVGEAAAGASALPRATMPDFLNKPAGEGEAAVPPDPSEGVAFALWNEGRKEEAIAFLERQIALQKQPGPDVIFTDPSPRGWMRLPIRAGVAAMMLFAIGGALWAGLNPSGIDPDSSVSAAPEQVLEAKSEPAPAASPAPPAARPEQPGEQAEESSTSPAPMLAAVEPPPEDPMGPPVRTIAGAREEPPETGLAGLTPASGPATEANEAETEAPFDELPEEALGETPDEPLRAVVAKASQNAAIAPDVPEARLPKPRPEISAGEAMALVRPPQRAAPPAPQTPVRERRQAQASAPPPETYGPPPGAVPTYGPYGEPQWIIVNPRLAERRAAAEHYIAQRRAMAERRAVEAYGPIYYDVRPYPY